MKPIAIIAVGLVAASGAFAFARTMDAVMPERTSAPTRANYVERNTAMPAVTATPVVIIGPVVAPMPAPDPIVSTAVAAASMSDRLAQSPQRSKAVPPFLPTGSLMVQPAPTTPAPQIKADFTQLSVSGVYR
ncbi:MAG: hypothetical protein Q4G49_05495 [Paracoccus sp. (in: a-proteobacteria)]|nr:hypothetical protein [Paracoccus sp. (in: a-proteobacteria)]